VPPKAGAELFSTGRAGSAPVKCPCINSRPERVYYPCSFDSSLHGDFAFLNLLHNRPMRRAYVCAATALCAVCRWYFAKLRQSWRWDDTLSRAGTRCSGQVLTQAPQRKHCLGACCEYSSLDRKVIVSVPGNIGASSVCSICPLKGPPIMGTEISPPACVTRPHNSETSVPVRAINIWGARCLYRRGFTALLMEGLPSFIARFTAIARRWRYNNSAAALRQFFCAGNCPH